MARGEKFWDEVRADFLATGLSYPQLAEKYHISVSAVKKKAMKEKWTSGKDFTELVAARQAEKKSEPAKPKVNRRSKSEPRKIDPAPKSEPAKSEPLPKSEPQPVLPPVTEEKIAEVLDSSPTLDEIIEGKRDRMAKFMEITDAMMDRIQEAMMSPEVVTPYALKMLASALRDLREMQGLNRSALDIEEQMARIAKIRSETRIVETEDVSGIILMPEIQEVPQPDE